jgi:hypothetical protein
VFLTQFTEKELHNRETIMDRDSYIQIKNKSIPIIKNYISKIGDILDIDENNKVSTTKITELNNYLRILSEHISIKEIESTYKKQSLLFSLFFIRLKPKETPTFETFKSELIKEISSYTNKPVKDYTVLFPLNISIDKLRTTQSFNVFGNILKINEWEKLENFLELQTLFDKAGFLFDKEKPYRIRTDFLPVTIEIEGIDSTEAFYNSLKPFNFLRSYLNLGAKWGLIERRWGGFQEPLGKFLPPPICGVFNNNGDLEKLYHSSAVYEKYPKNKLSSDEISDISEKIKKIKFTNDEKYSEYLLLAAVNKYGEAMDAIEEKLMFLSLWQILELLSLRSIENLNMRKTINRIKILLGKKETLKDLIEVIYSSRNIFVHEGIFPDDRGIEEVMYIKQIADVSLSSFFSLVQKYETVNELKSHYIYATKSNSELDIISNTIEIIKNNRTK